jgi:hypothetical protein
MQQLQSNSRYGTTKIYEHYLTENPHSECVSDRVANYYTMAKPINMTQSFVLF